MSKQSEIERFESRFSEEIIEIAVVTGPSGFGGGQGCDNIMWSASMYVIAWKIYDSNKPVVQEKYCLEALVDYEQLKILQKTVNRNSIIRLKVRMSKDNSKHDFMLIQIIDTCYKDSELENILREELKPVFYKDEVLGKFTFEKATNSFDTTINWMNSGVSLSFNYDKDENVIKDYLSTAHTLYNNQKEWDAKIHSYAADELLDLVNDWFKEGKEEYYESFDEEFDEEDEYYKYDEITKERFMNLMKIVYISIESNGEFYIECLDGDMFCGHCIHISGNINGEFEYAEI
ncbi:MULTISPECIES: DUF2262 domain-containing protein [Clostridium]|uniref:DUF2262 domain-containing protein n=1 Tax=Clostridium aquiflavi TaxID=3073603 RepID=A0ABU1EEH2_9CLOT|nr:MULTISPECIES: DUF2262 domain-containing protein [unclassified Clostridium]MDR5586359.1 DUF2262 domain-containing protein [Clostridium sp. 5N-1]NFG63392.1 DUF2262 domain-containing protein [Clostridium botulinum]NFQ09128.1 DUF2262 domain-containing protein [Clostridium botulinum]